MAVDHAMMVADAFVRQYYHILFHSPELVHRFYQDNSKLGRPDSSGNLITITTMRAIDEKILASESTKFQSEIETISAQESYKGGVLILVTGFLIGQDKIKRNFAQAFFLAPQQKGYFVLNDILRFVPASTNHNPKLAPTVDTQDSYNGGVLMLLTGHLADADKIKSFNQTLFLAPQEKGYFVLNDIFKGEETTHQEHEMKDDAPEVPEQEILSSKVQENFKERAEPIEREDDESNLIAGNISSDLKVELVVKREAPAKSRVVDKVVVADSKTASSNGDGPKKSYASIVKVLKENMLPSPATVAAPAKQITTNPPESQISIASEAPAVIVQPANENVEVREPEDAFTVYVKNLPLNATPAQLEEEFKRFGAIKPGGVQVRSNKQQGFCFGFVEFETGTSVQQAIEGSPVLIGGRQAYVEGKRPSGSRIGGQGRNIAGRGGYRTEGGRGRGGFYGNGRGYGRGDFGGWAGGRGGGGYYHQRMDGGGRAGSPSVDTSSAASFKEVPASA